MGNKLGIVRTCKWQEQQTTSEASGSTILRYAEALIRRGLWGKMSSQR